MSNIIHISESGKVGTKSGQKSGQGKNNVLSSISDSEIRLLRSQAGWLSVNQFSQLSGQHERQIKRFCKAGKYVKQCRQIVRDGRRPYQVHFSALPAAGIREYQRIVANVQPMTSEQIEARNEAFRERSRVTDYNADRALKRNSVLKLYQAFIRSGKGKLLDRKAAFCERFNRGGFLELEEERAVIGSVHWKTLDVWQKKLNAADGDPYGLATKYGATRDITMVSMREGEALMEFHPGGNHQLCGFHRGGRRDAGQARQQNATGDEDLRHAGLRPDKFPVQQVNH